MEREIIDKLFLELSQVTSAVSRKELHLIEKLEEANEHKALCIEALQQCYRKHCMADDYSQDIGWNELSYVLQTTLARVLGGDTFDAWVVSVKGGTEKGEDDDNDG